MNEIMRQRFFITSTGTGIGKSFITAGLVRQAKALGKSVAAYKPIMTGCTEGPIEQSDAGILLQALELPASFANIERIAPWRFKAPLAPSMAARLEKQSIDFNALVRFGHDAMAETKDVVLIEGVGGVMVPLDDTRTVLDWIEELHIEATLVTGTYLGALSHTLTALDALQHRKIPIFAIIVNESAESTVALQATVDELVRFTHLPIVPVKRRKTGEENISELRALIETRPSPLAGEVAKT